jgi:sporulation protein YlmC with PRC-barrel domain
MTESVPIDLGLGVLDHQLLDVDGRRCGKVDDLELEGLDGDDPRAVAIVVGPGAWPKRGRIGSLLGRLAPRSVAKVPWDQVKEVSAGVHLRSRAEELRLARGDRRAERWIERVPGARL